MEGGGSHSHVAETAINVLIYGCWMEEIVQLSSARLIKSISFGINSQVRREMGNIRVVFEVIVAAGII